MSSSAVEVKENFAEDIQVLGEYAEYITRNAGTPNRDRCTSTYMATVPAVPSLVTVTGYQPKSTKLSFLYCLV